MGYSGDRRCRTKCIMGEGRKPEDGPDILKFLESAGHPLAGSTDLQDGPHSHSLQASRRFRQWEMNRQDKGHGLKPPSFPHPPFINVYLVYHRGVGSAPADSAAEYNIMIS